MLMDATANRLQGGSKLTTQPSVTLRPAPPDLATAARALADQTHFIRTGDGVQLVCGFAAAPALPCA